MEWMLYTHEKLAEAWWKINVFSNEAYWVIDSALTSSLNDRDAVLSPRSSTEWWVEMARQLSPRSPTIPSGHLQSSAIFLLFDVRSTATDRSQLDGCSFSHLLQDTFLPPPPPPPPHPPLISPAQIFMRPRQHSTIILPGHFKVIECDVYTSTVNDCLCAVVLVSNVVLRMSLLFFILK